MTASSPRNAIPLLTASGIAWLRCPACHGSFSLETATQSQRILCGQCGRIYPVVDGLPVLIPDRSTCD